MRRRLRAFAGFSGCVLLAASAAAQPAHPNILMVIGDDVSADMIGAYRTDPDAHPRTPTIDALAAQGVMFRNAWANPVCATTRATIQTGRYAHRTQIYGPTGVLPESAQVIPEVLASQSYKTALVGKWGLAGTLSLADATVHAVRAGYDRYAGWPYAALSDYFDWNRRVATFHQSCNPISHQNGACIDISGSGSTSVYATTFNVFDAAAWVSSAHQNPSTHKPWFVVLAFNAAHTPFHRPADDSLHQMAGEFTATGGGEDCAQGEEGLCYRAMIEAMDNQLGVLLTWLNQDFDSDSETTTELAKTIVIFVGDNGTPPEVAPDEDRAKFTLFQGGVNVPLIVKGPGVAGSGVGGQPRLSEALVNTSDLFMTVRELAGSTTAISADHDSFSFVPVLTGAKAAIRYYAYSEVDGAHAGKAIRNRDGLKLQRSNEAGLKWFLFNLASSAGEQTNLVDPAGTTPELVSPDPALQVQLDEMETLLGNADWATLAPPAPNVPAANLDRDADAYADTSDNCSALGQDASQRCDTDHDGYGNLCDADFDNDGFAFPSDYVIWLADFATGVDGGKGTDMNCDGYVDASDYTLFLGQFQGAVAPGPSGLACAGTVPCL